MTGMRDVVFYVQLEPSFFATGRLRDVRAMRLTQRRPRDQASGTALIKLTVRVPESVFMPLRPEAGVVIPEDMILAKPIEVQATDAHTQEDTG